MREPIEGTRLTERDSGHSVQAATSQPFKTHLQGSFVPERCMQVSTTPSNPLGTPELPPLHAFTTEREASGSENWDGKKHGSIPGGSFDL